MPIIAGVDWPWKGSRISSRSVRILSMFPFSVSDSSKGSGASSGLSFSHSGAVEPASEEVSSFLVSDI